MCRSNVGFVTVLVATAAFVMPSATAVGPDYSKAEYTFAGSQIARYEGGEAISDGTVVLAAASSGAPRGRPRAGDVIGHDVSNHQGDVDWPRAWADGARFAYVKATEGTQYVNPRFAQQYNGSYRVGMIRGAYHFARPDVSSGAEQANHFVDHGGGWSPDGRTLPGALDIEYNPYGEVCYGLDPVAMSNWLRDFSDTYRARTGRFPMIYTSTKWWNRCTGANPGFAPNNPLWIARYNSFVGELPAGWQQWTIWQRANNGPLPGDQDLFNGSMRQLRAFTY